MLVLTSIRLPQETLDAIDALRGDVPRNRWFTRAINAALERQVQDVSDRAGLGDNNAQEPRRPTR